MSKFGSGGFDLGALFRRTGAGSTGAPTAPAANPAMAAPSSIFGDPSKIFSRGAGGILPERGSQAQYDLVSQLVKSGMGSAMNSGSPLLAFLAPMVGGGVLSRTQGLYDEAEAARALAGAGGAGGGGGGGGGGGRPGGGSAPDEEADPRAFTTDQARYYDAVSDATKLVSEALTGLTARGYTEAEAMARIAKDPIYGPQLELLGIDREEALRNATAPAAPAAQKPGLWDRFFGGGDAAGSPTPPASPSTPDNDPLGLR